MSKITVISKRFIFFTFWQLQTELFMDLNSEPEWIKMQRHGRGIQTFEIGVWRVRLD